MINPDTLHPLFYFILRNWFSSYLYQLWLLRLKRFYLSYSWFIWGEEIKSIKHFFFNIGRYEVFLSSFQQAPVLTKTITMHKFFNIQFSRNFWPLSLNIHWSSRQRWKTCKVNTHCTLFSLVLQELLPKFSAN